MTKDTSLAFILPDLPYDPAGFGDILSAETFAYHHGKHHQAYVAKTNELVAQLPDLSGASLSEVIAAAQSSGNRGLFNNSAQIWNHSFYWQCLTPEKRQPSGKLATMIDAAFGSTGQLVEALHREAVGHFASGWAWLILNGDKLEITSLHDADTPVVHGMTPLLTIDVWEHAYYVDYRNARPAYVSALLDRAIDWDFVAHNLDGAGVSRADQPG